MYVVVVVAAVTICLEERLSFFRPLVSGRPFFGGKVAHYTRRRRRRGVRDLPLTERRERERERERATVCKARKWD